MAINSITFGNINSANYGIYISGEGVFNAPARDAEVISIPGRNGSFLLDRGRFENIEVRYPAFNTATDKATFISNIDSFRNAIASKTGYQRLEDTFHPNEYRMASFIGGLEVNPTLYNDHTSQFEIVFNCKPQRWIKNADIPQYTTQSTQMTNNTRFNAYPLLEVTGYGDIAINDQHIIVENSVVGPVNLTSKVSASSGATASASYASGVLNAGDSIMMAAGTKVSVTVNAPAGTYIESFSPSQSGQTVNITSKIYNRSNPFAWAEIVFPELDFTDGTDTSYTAVVSMVMRYRKPDQSIVTTTSVIYFAVSYVASNRLFRTTITQTSGARCTFGTVTQESITGDSTVSTLGNPTYIDCELGEAYNIVGGEIVPVNNSVNIGNTLPYLAPGTNNITLPATVTRLGVAPRWWKI